MTCKYAAAKIKCATRTWHSECKEIANTIAALAFHHYFQWNVVGVYTYVYLLYVCV